MHAEVALSPAELSNLPVFPLQGVVLLPGGLLPLHIFEPRYRDMVRDALAGTRKIAIANLPSQPTFDDQGRPKLPAVCGVGSILSCEELPDGRYNMVLLGVARVDIISELDQVNRYRQVRAVMRGDDIGVDCNPERAKEQLLQVCREISRRIGHSGPRLRGMIADCERMERCEETISAALISDASTRQILLETRCPEKRIKLAAEHLQSLLGELENSDSVN